MRHFLLATVALVTLYGCGVSSSSDNSPTNTTNKILPTAAITVDGIGNDWTAVAPIKSDPAGDAIGNGSTDLIGFYAAKSGTKIAFMMKTQQNIAMPHTPVQAYSHYEIGIHLYTDEFCNNKIAIKEYFIVNNFTSSSGVNYHRIEDYTGLVGPQSTDVAFATDVLETSFDMSIFPTSMKSFRFSAYTQSFGFDGSNIMHDVISDMECYKLP